jgi:hypothetical protein
VAVTQYSLADFTVKVGTVSPATTDASCAVGTLTEGADTNMVDGIPVACAPYPSQVYAGTRWNVALDGAVDDSTLVAGGGLAVFLRTNVGKPGVIEMTPITPNAKKLPTIKYTVQAFTWPAATYPADGPATVSVPAMPLSVQPSYTAAP